jgi:TRAP-type uncharacterized transport system fused permease subunit
MRTSVTAFVYGMAAFLVPFMFFYSPELLMQGEWPQIIHYGLTALLGVYLLAAALKAWYFGPVGVPVRVVLFTCSLLLIDGGLVTDLLGIVPAVLIAAWKWRKHRLPSPVPRSG